MCEPTGMLITYSPTLSTHSAPSGLPPRENYPLRRQDPKRSKPVLALAVHRRALVRRVGLLTSRGWAQHIVDRWRDAVSNRPAAPQTADVDLAADVFFSNNPSRGGYRGMNVPSA